MRRTGHAVAAGLAALAGIMCVTGGALAQGGPPVAATEAPAAPAQEAAQEAKENWRTSPYHGVTDGFGQIIRCRCRFSGREYRLGEMVCMNTHVGTVLTRCDLLDNNTSWIPTSQPCEVSRSAPASGTSVARRELD